MLSGLLQYFPKNIPVLVQKLGAEKNCQNPFTGYFMTKEEKEKKSSMAIKPDRGGVRP